MSKFLQWIIIFSIIVVDIHLHLADVLMGEIFCLEINQHEAFQDVIIKYEIYVEMAVFDVETQFHNISIPLKND